MTDNAAYFESDSALVATDTLRWGGGMMAGPDTTFAERGFTLGGGFDYTLDQRRLVVPSGERGLLTGGPLRGLEGARLVVEKSAALINAQEIPLEAGWNQVGSPFGYAVPWDTVRAASGLPPAEVDGPKAWADTAYQQGESAMLRAWEGYFVWVAEQATLTLHRPR